MKTKTKTKEQIAKLQKELERLRQREKEERVLVDGDPEINGKWFKTGDMDDEGIIYLFCEKQKNGRYKAIKFCIMNDIRGGSDDDYYFLYEENGVEKRIPNDGEETLYYSFEQDSITKAELIDNAYHDYEQVSNLDLVLQGFNPEAIVKMAKNKENHNQLFLFQNKAFIRIKGYVEMWEQV